MPCRSFILPSDVLPFLPDPEEAAAGFRMLDVNGDGRVTISEMREVIAKIYKCDP